MGPQGNRTRAVKDRHRASNTASTLCLGILCFASSCQSVQPSQADPSSNTPVERAAHEPPAPPPRTRNLRSAEDARAALIELDQRLQTLALAADLETWSALPDGSWRTEPVGVAHYEFVADRERFREGKTPPGDPNGPQELYLYDGERVTIALPSGTGPGVGKVRAPQEYDDRRWQKVYWALPLRTMQTLFRFDLERTALDLDGVVEFEGVEGVQISWGNTYQRCRAILVRDYGWSPVYLERSYDGVVDYTCTFEHFVPPTAAAPAYPTRITHRSIRPGASPHPPLPAGTPESVRKAPAVVHAQRYDVIGLELNQPVPADAFTVKWDRGAEIIDEIAGKTYFYQVPDSERPWPPAE